MAQRLIYRWDLDKTYLQTEFDSLRGLVRIPFESAEDKRAAPGVAALIRGLRTSGEKSGYQVRVRFVSGSPPQIGKAILEKLALDGIEHDGVTFKDQWGRIRRGKFRDLREQVGYKLTELLRDRRDEPEGSVEYLFGDDWESDPLIYSLYADVVAGDVDRRELGEILGALRVDPELRDLADVLASRVQRGRVVQRIFINLARRTSPGAFRGFGARLVPTYNYLQTAACLFGQGVLDVDAVGGVIDAMRRDNDYRDLRLAAALRDIESRRHLGRASAAELAYQLSRRSILADAMAGRSRWLNRLLRWGRVFAGAERFAPQPINYVRLVPKLAERLARTQSAEAST